MNASSRPRPLDRYTPIGGLADSVQWLLRRSLVPAIAVLAGETGLLFFTGSRGATAFAMIALGTILVLALWRARGIGLTVVPLIAIQNLIVYGLPIVIGHEVLSNYPENYITNAGLEVLIYSCSLIGAWRIGMGLFHPGSDISRALQGFRQEGAGKLKRLGFTLIIGSTLYLVLDSMHLLATLYSYLPDGAASMITTLVAAAGACGFFLGAMFVGSRTMPTGGRVLFWSLLAGNCLISASGFLLSATTGMFASVLIGLFWSSGRMPWRYLVVVGLMLSFLNLGKFTMRERYWGADGEANVTISLGQMPHYYGEWIQASLAAVGRGRRDDAAHDAGGKSSNGQNLLERVNNLRSLLFVIDAIDAGHIPPLHGQTYSLIPPLLVPRIFWPDKPRTHEGQILLNVHFGRQELDATMQTYIAWGLLPEAYGNFGAKAGAIFLGVCLGLFFAWLESFTAHKVLLSLEGFISFTILLGLMGSFEMVASILVTSIFQSIVVLIVACFPFVERTVLRRPPSATS